MLDTALNTLYQHDGTMDTEQSEMTQIYCLSSVISKHLQTETLLFAYVPYKSCKEKFHKMHMTFVPESVLNKVSGSVDADDPEDDEEDDNGNDDHLRWFAWLK